jgi:hypothetical protein
MSLDLGSEFLKKLISSVDWEQLIQKIGYFGILKMVSNSPVNIKNRLSADTINDFYSSVRPRSM